MLGTILAIAGVATQIFGWFMDFKWTKEGNKIGIKEKNWLFRGKGGNLDVKKAIFLGFGIEYGVAIGAYFLANGFQTAEQGPTGWHAFGCTLISFGVFHYIYSLKSKKAIRYRKANPNVEWYQ